MNENDPKSNGDSCTLNQKNLDNGKDERLVSYKWTSELKIWSHSYLDTLERRRCEKCGHFRRYFCYRCYTFMGDASKVPSLNLYPKLDM